MVLATATFGEPEIVTISLSPVSGRPQKPLDHLKKVGVQLKSEISIELACVRASLRLR